MAKKYTEDYSYTCEPNEVTCDDGYLDQIPLPNDPMGKPLDGEYSLIRNTDRHENPGLKREDRDY